LQLLAWHLQLLSKKTTLAYWFTASNSEPIITNVTLVQTSAPVQQDVLTPTCNSGFTDYCSLAFPNVYFDAGTSKYFPSTDGTQAHIITQANYGTAQNSGLKN